MAWLKIAPITGMPVMRNMTRKITVTTLIFHAEWDADLPSYLAQEYFKKLTNVPYKRLVEFG
jgi:pimeloyl-ACP methyl ester carboxylesterase